MQISIVAYTVLVNRYHLCCSIVIEHSQCVVDCRLTQRGNLIAQTV